MNPRRPGSSSVLPGAAIVYFFLHKAYYQWLTLDYTSDLSQQIDPQLELLGSSVQVFVLFPSCCLTCWFPLVSVFLRPKKSVRTNSAGALNKKSKLSLFWLGVVFLWAGAGLHHWAHHELGRNWFAFVRMRKENHQLVTSGCYGYVRHPMYTGFFLMAVGSARLATVLVLDCLVSTRLRPSLFWHPPSHPSTATWTFPSWDLHLSSSGHHPTSLISIISSFFNFQPF